MIGVTHVYDSFTSLPSHPMLATYSGLEYVKKPAIKELPPPRTRALAEGMFPASSETKLCAGKVEVLSIKSFWKFIMFSINGLPYGFPAHSHPKNPFEASSFTTNPTTRRLSIDQESHHELQIIIRVAADSNKQSCGDF